MESYIGMIEAEVLIPRPGAPMGSGLLKAEMIATGKR